MALKKPGWSCPAEMECQQAPKSCGQTCLWGGVPTSHSLTFAARRCCCCLQHLPFPVWRVGVASLPRLQHYTEMIGNYLSEGARSNVAFTTRSPVLLQPRPRHRAVVPRGSGNTLPDSCSREEVAVWAVQAVEPVPSPP